MDNYRIEFPKRITSSTIFTTWSKLEIIRPLRKDENPTIVLDFSELEYVDPEGINYIALIPYYIKLITDKIKIVLPFERNVIQFFEYTGLLRILFDEFKIEIFQDKEHALFQAGGRKYESIRSNARIGLINKKSFSNFMDNEFRKFEKFFPSSFESRYLMMAFYELSRNVFDHSGQIVGGFSFHYRNNYYLNTYSKSDTDNQMILAITDLGIGIKNSLIKNSNIETGKSDLFYLKQAVKEGISSTGIPGRGMGLAMIINRVRKVYLTSGSAKIYFENGKIINENETKNNLKGTSIYVVIDNK